MLWVLTCLAIGCGKVCGECYECGHVGLLGVARCVVGVINVDMLGCEVLQGV